MLKLLSWIGSAVLTFAMSAGILKIRSPRYTQPISSAPAKNPTLNLPANEPVYRCDKKPDLPILIKRLLDKHYRGWSFPDVTDEGDCYSVHYCGGPEAYAQLLQGDFNDDGRLDYAVLIQQTPNSTGNLIIAFLRKRTSYEMRLVTSEGGSYLVLMHKGECGYDFDAQKEFAYRRDTIADGAGMGGTSYLYENRKFRAIITSD